MPDSNKESKASLPQKTVMKSIVASASFEGPLPPPSVMAGYKQLGVLPDIMKLAMDANERENRLVAIQESNAEQQREIAKTQSYIQKSSAITENIVYGCVCFVVLLVVVSIFGLAFVFAWRSQYIPATVAFLISIGLPRLIALVYSTKRK